MTVEEIKNGLDAAHKKAGDNAYFGNGFHAGVAFAEKKSKANEMYEAIKKVTAELRVLGTISDELAVELFELEKELDQ